MKRIVLFLFLSVAFTIRIIQWIKNYINQQNLVMKRKIIIINIMKTKVSALARLNNGKTIKNYHSRIWYGQNNCEILLGAFETPKWFCIQIDSKCQVLIPL